MEHTSFIEISRSALRNNLEFLQKVIGENCKLSCVVKGNAYGHGLTHYAPLAESLGQDHFCVFSTVEASELKKVLKPDTGIMIMGMIDPKDLPWVIENNIHFFVFNLDRLEHAVEAATKLGKKAYVHIELDTGMNRTGFDKQELKTVAELLEKNSDVLSFEGLCTHYAGAESIANHVRVQKQIKEFNSRNRYLTEKGLVPKSLHTACSAAAMNYSKTRMDMARIGIMQYGFWPSKETFISFISRQSIKEDPLKQVIKWKSKVMSTHHVRTGEFIGYGTSFMAENEMKIAVIPVGYAYGYSRSLSNQGRILINGKRISVIGLVNMNMLIADITYAEETKVGDEVVLIGKQGDMSVSVSSFSELSDQLNYELLTRLPRDIPRIIKD